METKEKRRRVMIFLIIRWEWSVANVAELMNISPQAIYKDMKVHKAEWEDAKHRNKVEFLPELIDEIRETPEFLQMIQDLEMDDAAQAAIEAGAYRRLVEISTLLAHEASKRSEAAALRTPAPDVELEKLKETQEVIKNSWKHTKKGKKARSTLVYNYDIKNYYLRQ